jgi:hypothetical protein
LIAERDHTAEISDLRGVGPIVVDIGDAPRVSLPEIHRGVDVYLQILSQEAAMLPKVQMTGESPAGLDDDRSSIAQRVRDALHAIQGYGKDRRNDEQRGAIATIPLCPKSGGVALE